MKHSAFLPLLLLTLLLQSACSSKAVYVQESFETDSPFRMRADGDVALVCEGARRALLGQGYLIEQANAEGLRARKAIKRDDQPNTFIEMHVACLPEPAGSTLFATGLLSTYALKKSSSSASVGLSAVGSISLPIGQSADSLVKVSEETIDDRDFYNRFFAAVSSIVGEMQAAATPAPQPEAAAAPAAPRPAPLQSGAATVDSLEGAPAPGPAPEPAQLEPNRSDAYLLPQPGAQGGTGAQPGQAAPAVIGN